MPSNKQLQRTVKRCRGRGARPLSCGVRRHGGVGGSAEALTKKAFASACGALAALLCCVSAHADCFAKAFPEAEVPRNPIYEVVACGPAEPVVELLRQSDPDWFGKLSYDDGDVVVTVSAANSDARKRMWRDVEYWYYPSGCGRIREGMRFAQPELKELCCDVGPLRDLPCGVGGKQLLTLAGLSDLPQ